MCGYAMQIVNSLSSPLGEDVTRSIRENHVLRPQQIFFLQRFNLSGGFTSDCVDVCLDLYSTHESLGIIYL